MKSLIEIAREGSPVVTPEPILTDAEYCASHAARCGERAIREANEGNEVTAFDFACAAANWAHRMEIR